LTTAAPAILAVEMDSAWVVVIAVSLVLLPVTLVLRRLIRRPGGLLSSLLLVLPLGLPIVTAVLYNGGVLPEVALLRPVTAGLRPGGSGHFLWLGDRAGVGIPYSVTESAGNVMLLIGLTASSLMLVRRAVGVVALRRAIGRSTYLGEEEHDWIREMVHDLATTASIRTPEVLMLPEGFSGAFATSGRVKRILISRELIEALDRDELAGILAHEIAHIAARDVQVVFGAGLLRDMVAWNPVGHVAYKLLENDREYEADRSAAVLTGKPLAVASSLVKVCELMRRHAALGQRATLAFFRPRSRLKRRVKYLLALADNVTAPPPASYVPYLAAACLAAALGLQVGARIGASPDAGALAIVLGAPDTTTAAVWKADVPPKFVGKQKARKGPQKLFGAWPARLAVGQGDFPKFLSALSRWAQRHKEAPREAIWRSARSWRGIPLLGGPGNLSLYRLDPLGRIAASAKEK
jgi:Zn-dependent protease with chaperone function